jgi:hypothetical protein
MTRRARIVMFSKRFVQVSAIFLLGGLIGASGLAGCDDGSSFNNPEETTGDATKACVGGPKFDPAGTKNVGNNKGGQFIGGQCLSAKDCASGCCALPCGICSGPGAQFQAGKKGCGFVAKKAKKPAKNAKLSEDPNAPSDDTAADVDTSDDVSTDVDSTTSQP